MRVLLTVLAAAVMGLVIPAGAGAAEDEAGSKPPPERVGAVQGAQIDDESMLGANAGIEGEPTFTRTINVRTSQQLKTAIRSARPGTRILLAPGQYVAGYFQNVHGREGSPILIAAADPANMPVIRGGSTALQLTRASFVELRDLVIERAGDNGLNIDDGGRNQGPSHHITLRRLVVRDVGGRGNQDGIKLSGVNDSIIDQCQVINWGTGGSGIDMVGCRRVLITHSRFEHRAGQDYGNGVQAKGGSLDIIVRRCFFFNAASRAVQIGGRTQKQYFRPQFMPYEARNVTVEGCIFIGSGAAVAFVSCENAVVRYNTIYQPEKYIMRILREQNARGAIRTQYGTFAHNLVVFDREGVHEIVNMGGGTRPRTFLFTSNFWFSPDAPNAPALPLPGGERDGTWSVDPQFNPPVPGDFSVARESPAMNVGAHAMPAGGADEQRDDSGSDSAGSG